MKFRRSPLFFLLLTTDGTLSQQQPSYGKGGGVSNFQRYAAEDQAVPSVNPPQLPPEVRPSPAAVPASTQAQVVESTVVSAVVTATVPNIPATAPVKPITSVAPRVEPSAAPTRAPLATPPSVAATKPLSMTTTVIHTAPSSAPVRKQPVSTQTTIVSTPPPRNSPNLSSNLVKLSTDPVIASHVRSTVSNEARRLEEFDANLKSREKALRALEKTLNERKAILEKGEAKVERLQDLFTKKSQSLDEEMAKLAEIKDNLSKKITTTTTSTTPTTKPFDAEEAAAQNFEATKLELLEALRTLKLKNLYSAFGHIPLSGIHRGIAAYIYELKRELVDLLSLDPEYSHSWASLLHAMYRRHFGTSKLGFSKFLGICVTVLLGMRILRRINVMQMDQKALASRQDALLEQLSLVTDEVKRGCFTTNRYCENAIKELMLAEETRIRHTSPILPEDERISDLDRVTDSNTHCPQLANDAIKRADYQELYTENNKELIHRTFQMLLHIVQSTNVQQTRREEKSSSTGHLVYLEWLMAAQHKDVLAKLEKLDDKLDLVNLQLAAATECIYNDCVAQIRDSAKWLPFLELIEAFVARDIENTFRDLIAKFCANPKDEYVVQQLMGELHKLGGIFDCKYQKILKGADDVSVREIYRRALSKAHEKFLESCPFTDVLKPPERFERLLGTVDLFRKVVFGVLNQLPASSVDVSNYVALVYGSETAMENTSAPTPGEVGDDNIVLERDQFSYSPVVAQVSKDDIQPYAMPDPSTASEILRGSARPPSCYTEYVEWFRSQMLASAMNVASIPSLPTFQPTQSNEHTDAHFTLA